MGLSLIVSSVSLTVIAAVARLLAGRATGTSLILLVAGGTVITTCVFGWVSGPKVARALARYQFREMAIDARDATDKSGELHDVRMR
jgi:hypothetical protein